VIVLNAIVLNAFLVMDFDVKRCTRRCATNDREFQPGEVFYSILVVEGPDVVRYDYGEQAWEGPPENILGWWKSQMPDPTARKLHWAPNDVMLHYFEQLTEKTDNQDTRYVLALLLLRRRVLRMEESPVEPAEESVDNSKETMSFFCPRNEKQYQINIVYPNADRVEQIQEELARLLFAKAG